MLSSVQTCCHCWLEPGSGCWPISVMVFTVEGFPSPANKIALKCTQLCVGGAGQGAESGLWPGHTTWSLSRFPRYQWLINFITHCIILLQRWKLWKDQQGGQQWHLHLGPCGRQKLGQQMHEYWFYDHILSELNICPL